MPRYFPGVTLALTLLIAAPLLLVDVPPLLDYPNHLARLYLLAQGADDPVLAPMFTTQWAIIPNLAIDVIGPPLIRLLPVHCAGRILLAVLLLLPFAGVLAYSRALFGRAYSWPLASALIAINAPFLLGFLNFQAGIGGALLLAAFWIARRDRQPTATVVLTMIGMIALFFCHLMGVIFALVLIGAWEAERIWRDGDAARRGFALLAIIMGPARLYQESALGTQSAGIEYSPLGEKFSQLLWPFTAYSLSLDILTAATIAALLVAGALTRRLAAPLSTRIALITLAALYAAAPFAFKGTQSLDTRFTVMLILLLFAGLRPAGFARSGAIMTTAAFAVLLVARIAVVAIAWHGHASDLAGLRRIIADIPPGARVLAASVAPSEAPGYWSHAPLARRLSNGIRTESHLAALVLIERHAFWPLLFDDPAQQPITWTPNYQTLADQAGTLIDHRALQKLQLCAYDFLLILDAGGDPDLAHYHPNDLILRTEADIAALFAVRPASRDCK